MDINVINNDPHVIMLRKLINFCYNVRAISFTDSRFPMEDEFKYVDKYKRGSAT